MDIVLYLFVLVVLILLSSFFSGIEIALFSVSKVDVLIMSRQGLKGSKSLKQLRDKPNRLLVTILIGNNLVNILAASIATMLAIDVFGSAGVGVATGIMTFLILVFGEIVPKSLAVRHAKYVSLKVAGIVLFFERVIYPIVFVFEMIADSVGRLFGSGGSDGSAALVSEEKIKQMVLLGTEEGSIEKDEQYMINNVFKLNDIAVDSVMIKCSQIESIPVDISVDKLLDEIAYQKVPYSRIPVYKGLRSNIIGILYPKDLIKFLGRDVSKIDVRGLIKKQFRIRQHMKADDLLEEFRIRKVHIAIVEDKSGRFLGIVTMEDLIEELIGDIKDESDVLRSKMV